MTPDPGFAPAKINLTLHVTGRRADGYHLLDSVVAFADLGDRLTAGPGDGLTVTGPFAQGVPTDDTNLIRRALDMAGAPRAVVLEKNLPHPGGIGGGSSDAAAALRLVGAVLPTEALLRLGADLPVCVAARAARMRGIGERVDPLTLPPLPAVLLHPGLDCPTGAVFSALASPDNPGQAAVPERSDAPTFLRWLAAQRNDLEPPAMSAAPGIAAALDALRGTGAALARMSGSGATCFGIYDSPEAARAAAARLDRPGWWVRATTLT
ncbi:4-(cytidine 5'-diphospho)-2-C-methyl-D-erythritol kinase [Jannaschia seohaensis]|uniref:4-diphosphocytidyl-2-C-methyl-D-erythritol kinase n=1 Tax=Jannaschia seohaensis TaxID=475081 RepID=A0A2Y9ATK5_9RHOB|nr:4-(cytidine 5'-diphospho)-2-C-methyl-D-erythritol kinase [Jannaschia seohaensis]PWJ18153.1 4-diphosphocytidyl-2-C-methyl-D-erythritol kinase [Jannaschia seohaensis]SSA46678.1 4-diphosphocytidyl-2-C-methyl-D-erythritol kinase [Jannaschia seohaensis]